MSHVEYRGDFVNMIYIHVCNGTNVCVIAHLITVITPKELGKFWEEV